MGVLDGVKVVELAEFGFVPSCGAVLADWGADVVKVERITGDPLRHVQGAGLVADTGDFNFLWEQMNRNKRGIASTCGPSTGARRWTGCSRRPTSSSRTSCRRPGPRSTSSPRTSGRSTPA